MRLLEDPKNVVSKIWVHFLCPLPGEGWCPALYPVESSVDYVKLPYIS